MSSDEQIDTRLKEIGRAAAPGDSIADDVMRSISAGQPAEVDAAMPRSPRKWWVPWVGVAAGLLIGIGSTHLLTRPGRTSQTTPSGPAIPSLQVAVVKGTVLVKHLGSKAWNELASSTGVWVGDVYQAGPRSEMTLSFQDGSTLVLAANSRLSLEHYNGGMRLDLGAGTIKASLKSPHPPFVVRTPTGRIEALGTEFTVNVE